MAATPLRLRDMDGNVLHTFASESFILEAKLRQGSVRGRTRTTQTNVVARSGRSPAWGGRSWSADQLLVDYWIDPSNVSTHETYLSQLEAVFPQDDEDDLGQVWFEITEDGVEKRCLASIERLQPSDSSDHDQRLGHFVGVFSMLGSRWYSATAASVSAASGTSPLARSVTGGDQKSEEISLTVKPTAAKSAANGQRYLAHVNLKWENQWSANQLPVDITGGGWAHATEVTATRSLSTGNDVEVRWKGLRTSRWSDNWNAAGTKVWCVLDFPAARYWTLKAATTNSDTTWYFTEDLVNMPTLPHYAWVDNEVVLVTAIDTVARTWTVDRAERSTSGAIHAAAGKVYWLPAAQMVDLVWGYTGAAAPDYLDATIKPMINLSSSTNGSFVLADFQEVRDSGSTQARYPRAMSAYTLDVVDRGEDFLYQNYVPYTGTINASPSDATPATKMCIAYRSAGAKTGHPLQTAWGIRCDVGISQVDYTYWMNILYHLTAPAREARLLVTAIDGDGNRSVLRTIAITSGSGPQTASLSDAISPPAREVRWEIEAWRTPSPNEPSDGDGFEIDGVTFTLSTSQDVGVLFGSRQDAYEFGRPTAPMTIANGDGKTLKLNMVVKLNDTITINVGERSITTPDGIGQSHLMSGDWPYLPDGSSNYTLTETNSGTLELGVSSYRKGWA